MIKPWNRFHWWLYRKAFLRERPCGCMFDVRKKMIVRYSVDCLFRVRQGRGPIHGVPTGKGS